MKVIIIDNGSSYIRDLKRIFASDETVIIAPDDIDLEKITPGTLVVLSGGHALPVLWHDKYYVKELELIRNYPGPILGVCLGFELIAHAYGNHLSLLPRRVHAKRAIELTKEGDRYFSQNRIIAPESHRFALHSTSHPLISLGISKSGIEIIRHVTKPIFAVQFHLEKIAGDDGKAFFGELRTALGE
mgnify:CR=1 FL=1